MSRNRYDIDETLESPFDLSHFKRAMVYIKKHKWAMIAALIFSAVSVVVSLFTPIIMRHSIDVSVPNKDIPQIILLGILMLVTIFGSVMLSNVRQRIMTRVGQDIIYDIRKDLFAHLQKLPFQYYDDRPQGKVLIRVVNYVNSVSDMLSNGLVNFVLEIFNIIFITIFMFFVDVKLSLIIVSGLPVFVGIMYLMKKSQRRAWQDVSNKSSNLNAYMQESISGVRVTQLFTREKENYTIFERLSMLYRKAWMRAIYISHSIFVIVDTLQTTILALIYVIGLLIIGPSTATFGTILAMSGYASRFWEPIMGLSNIYNSFINNMAYLERIFEAMDEPVTVGDAEDAYELPEIKGDLSFEDVTFSYEPGKTILENLSFDVKAGESIALVGPTGAGKTTVVNLISRFYDIQGGKITIDGHDISKVTLESLRKQMGIMLQDSFIFSGTILDNIKYGKLDATMEEVILACETVRADEFISEMEDGYNTEVNERGSALSAGQRQLVSFARTLLSDPKILILDEATSSIDAKTERLLQNGLQELLKGRTSFLIAHRLSTIRHCDRIMFINDKGITECGSHDELIARRGDYYNLYNSQKQKA